MSTETDFICDRCGERFPSGRPGRSSMPGDWAQLIVVDMLDRPINQARFIRHLDICASCKRNLLDYWLKPEQAAY